MEFILDDNREILNISLNNDIDTKECKKIRNLIDGYILKYQPKQIIFNMIKVEFMDSSGIGLLMGRYNLAKMFNSKVKVINPSKRIQKVIELTDLGKYIEIEV